MAEQSAGQDFGDLDVPSLSEAAVEFLLPNPRYAEILASKARLSPSQRSFLSVVKSPATRAAFAGRSDITSSEIAGMLSKEQPAPVMAALLRPGLDKEVVSTLCTDTRAAVQAALCANVTSLGIASDPAQLYLLLQSVEPRATASKLPKSAITSLRDALLRLSPREIDALAAFGRIPPFAEAIIFSTAASLASAAAFTRLSSMSGLSFREAQVLPQYGAFLDATGGYGLSRLLNPSYNTYDPALAPAIESFLRELATASWAPSYLPTGLRPYLLTSEEREEEAEKTRLVRAEAERSAALKAARLAAAGGPDPVLARAAVTDGAAACVAGESGDYMALLLAAFASPVLASESVVSLWLSSGAPFSFISSAVSSSPRILDDPRVYIRTYLSDPSSRKSFRRLYTWATEAYFRRPIWPLVERELALGLASPLAAEFFKGQHHSNYSYEASQVFAFLTPDSYELVPFSVWDHVAKCSPVAGSWMLSALADGGNAAARMQVFLSQPRIAGVTTGEVLALIDEISAVPTRKGSPPKVASASASPSAAASM